MHSHLPALLIAMPLTGAFALPFIGRLGKVFRNTIFLFFSSLTLLISVFLVIGVGDGVMVYTFGSENFALTLPSGALYPARVIFEIDAFSAIAILCTSFLAFAGAVFSVRDMDNFSGRSRFMALFLLMTAGIFGMCASGDLFNFFIFLQMVLISSCGLISFWRDKPVSVEVAFKFMLYSQVVAVFFLVALALLYGKYNTVNMAALALITVDSALEKLVITVFICVLIFCSGAFFIPDSWFPDVCAEVPSGASCLLVSFSLASLYSIGRICLTVFPRIASCQTVALMLVTAGSLTMILSALISIEQNHVKRMMGFIAVSQAGFVLVSFGVRLWAFNDRAMTAGLGEGALYGGLIHSINYALTASLTFLCGSSLYHTTGTQSSDRMGGLVRNMPWTAGIFLFAAVSAAGFPPTAGFAAKWLIYESSFAFYPLLSAIAMVTSVLMTASFFKAFSGIFLGPARKRLSKVKETPWGMLGGMGLLCLLIFLLSVFTGWVKDNLLEKALAALLDNKNYISAVMGGK